MNNQSSLSEFFLLEFSQLWKLQILHVFVFLLLYLATVLGNLLIVSVIAFNHHLHTPMYFFLMNLAIIDLSSVSVIIPKSMANSLMNNRHISYTGCVAQVFFFVLFFVSDYLLLTLMAYDRYVAICNPLQYQMLMNRRACIEMVAIIWITSLFCGGLHASSTFAIPFCSNVINQFFCDIPHLLTLTCSEINLVEMGVLAFSIVFAFGCFVFLIFTYIHIFIAVLRIPSVQGRKKAFSTCLPHLVVFSTLVLTAWSAYLRPTSNAPSHLDLIVTVMYAMVPPMLNPIIYSMRNKEIKIALSNLFGIRNSSMND